MAAVLIPHTAAELVFTLGASQCPDKASSYGMTSQVISHNPAMWRIIQSLALGMHIFNTDEKTLRHICYSVVEQHDLEESGGRASLMQNWLQKK